MSNPHLKSAGNALDAKNMKGNSSELIMKVKVLGAKHLKGSKGEHLNSLVRVQFADYDSKDSTIVNDTPNPEFNFNYEHSHVVDETLVDQFANSRLVVSLFEALPKDKTMLLGTVEISLFDRFLKPKTKNLSIKDVFPVIYTNNKLLHPGTEVPEMELQISISRPILSESEQSGSIVSFTIQDVYPVPEEWTLKEGSDKDMNTNIYCYNLEFNLPIDAQNSQRKITINNGLLVPCEALKISDTPKTISESEAANPTVLSKSADSSITLDSKKVLWAYTYHVFMSSQSIQKLKEKAKKKESLDLEFSRSLHPKFATVVDSSVQKYKAIAYVDLSPLLFPGVYGLHGHYQLNSYDSIPHDGQTRDAPGTAGSEKGKGMISGKSDVSPYKALGCGINFKILLAEPLVEKSSVTLVNCSVRDFIPKRNIPNELIQEKRALKADQEYRVEIQAIVGKLIEEYREAILHDNIDTSGADSVQPIISSNQTVEQQRKKNFMYHLNRNGAYFNFKEKLKSAAVQIVREKFNRKAPFSSKNEQQLFLSEVYVYLTDQMHVAINQMLSDKDQAFTDPTLGKSADFEALKEFADSAEYNFQIKKAFEYHQERVAKFEDRMDAWYDYACFCLRNGESAKGVECMNEVLSRNSKHIPSLLGYGALLCMKENFEECEICFRTALDIQPENSLAHALTALYYDIIGNGFESEKHNQLAMKFQPGKDSIYITTAKFLININAGHLAETSLSRELLASGRQVMPYLLLADLEIHRRDFKMALHHIGEALDLKKDDPRAWSTLGHLNFLQEKWNAAKDAYETVLSLTNESDQLVVAYNRLGCIYLKQALENHELNTHLAKLSKSVFLQACEAKPSSSSWLGAGRASFALGEIEEAEDAYSEANVLNNRDSEVWAHLAVLNLHLGRQYEAKQSLAQALRLGIKELDLLRTMGAEFAKTSHLQPAIQCYQLYLELDPERSDIHEKLSEVLHASQGKRHGFEVESG